MLSWLTFWLLQAVLTCKYNFILYVFDMWPAGRYLRFFAYDNTLYTSVFSEQYIAAPVCSY